MGSQPKRDQAVQPGRASSGEAHEPRGLGEEGRQVGRALAGHDHQALGREVEGGRGRAEPVVGPGQPAPGHGPAREHGHDHDRGDRGRPVPRRAAQQHEQDDRGQELERGRVTVVVQAVGPQDPGYEPESQEQAGGSAENRGRAPSAARSHEEPAEQGEEHEQEARLAEPDLLQAARPAHRHFEGEAQRLPPMPRHEAGLEHGPRAEERRAEEAVQERKDRVGEALEQALAPEATGGKEAEHAPQGEAREHGQGHRVRREKARGERHPGHEHGQLEAGRRARGQTGREEPGPVRTEEEQGEEHGQHHQEVPGGRAHEREHV